MPRDSNEPQSYGSGSDWLTGRTGQKVNDPKATPPPEHRDFYDSSRETQILPNQGGLTSDVQLAESAQAPGGSRLDGEASGGRVTGQPGGAKRDSFFKRRDYE